MNLKLGSPFVKGVLGGLAGVVLAVIVIGSTWVAATLYTDHKTLEAVVAVIRQAQQQQPVAHPVPPIDTK